MSMVNTTSQIPGLRWESDEDFIKKLHEGSERNVRQTALYFGVSRQAVYNRIQALQEKGGLPATDNPQNVNPATAQGYEVTNEAYRTTAHQGGVN